VRENESAAADDDDDEEEEDEEEEEEEEEDEAETCGDMPSMAISAIARRLSLYSCTNWAPVQSQSNARMSAEIMQAVEKNQDE
jgi:hypothetical protein